MTTFNLAEHPGAWFPMEGGGRVRLRPMTAEVLAAIRKQTTKTHVEYQRVAGKAERFKVVDQDEDAANARFWDHVIMAWEHFLDGAGQPIPCTPETKLLLLAKSPKFARTVAEGLDRLQQDEAAQAEAAEKN